MCDLHKETGTEKRKISICMNNNTFVGRGIRMGQGSVICR